MAGHSHSANVAIKKGKQDRIRMKVFAKLSKNIMVAARSGPDPDFNASLRGAVELARAQSMPNDKIEYAIKRGAGLLEGQKITEVICEAYAPGGVALLIECVTDNPNRTRPEIGRLLSQFGGKLGAANSVLWMFKRRGLLAVKCAEVSEEKLMEMVLAAGADDLAQSGDVYEILTGVEAFEAVRKAVEQAGLKPTMAGLMYLSDNEVEVNDQTARTVLDLLEALQDHDEVNEVHSNLKHTDRVLALLAGQP
jgi:YebC/PmpR family DNA-binding regulatory protein